MHLAVSRQRHILHAAFLWVLVGTMLTLRGMAWVVTDIHTNRLLVYIIPMALVLGILKGALILQKSSARVIARIQLLAEATPVWQVFSLSMYLLVAGMMGFGIACRLVGAHWHIVGIIGILYLIVGIALITGSRTYWRAAVYSRGH